MCNDTDCYLDKHDDISISLGSNLPHWQQSGKIQYVTFRVSGSLPLKEVERLKHSIAIFEANNPKPWNKDTEIKFRKKLSQKTESILHSGKGYAPFLNSELRKIVSDVLLFRDGQHYEMIMFVIMPNHIHMLLCPYDGFDLSKIIQSIKRYSAALINKRLNRTGSFWHREYYDRIVRNEDHFKHCISYIYNNPKNLPPSHYTMYRKN